MARTWRASTFSSARWCTSRRGLLDELLIVARADELDVIDRHLSRWSELPLRIVVEDEHFPAFRRFTPRWQIRPWQRQQIIKLNAPALTSSLFVLTLDPDVVAVMPDLPRAPVAGRPGAARAQGPHRASPLVAALSRPAGCGPRARAARDEREPRAPLAAVLGEVQRRLEDIGGRPWMEDPAD